VSGRFLGGAKISVHGWPRHELCKSVVLVLEQERRVNIPALAASFDMDPYWHSPAGDEYAHGCYHMVKLGNRLRLLAPPETPCESWGYLLHMIWRDFASLPTTQHIQNRFFIREAGLQCSGSARDESLVQTIAEVFVSSGKSVFGKRCKLDLSLGVHSARRNAGRADWELPEEYGAARSLDDFLDWKREVPKVMDAGVEAILRANLEREWVGSYRRDQYGHKKMKAHALYSNQLRHGSTTRSVWKDRLQLWLSTDEGREWNARRDALLDKEGQTEDIDDIHEL
jgi:hypothetical protein